ncbi:MAG: class I SAM-dependent rRNA methyltransferase [Alphaproteobacteria bacterium]|nr:class I SAM-dependent rRNA methyltransferase [Alphaproteobacteria bacterium]
MTHPSSFPVVRLRPNKSPQKIRFGFPWVFADELVLDRRTRNIEAGTIVELQTADRQPLGLCAFNAESKIICRMMERDVAKPIDRAWLERRLRHALTLRETLYYAPFYRLIHAEADGLPGVIIDRFGDVAVLQPNAAWAETMLDDLVAALVAVTGVKSVLKNGMGRARQLEGLVEETVILTGKIDKPVPVKMNGAVYLADLLGGQKTGIFYDQRENHAFASRLVQGLEVLDVFSHVGGFALSALAAGAKSALCVDGSAPALALAALGAEKSGFSAQFSTVKGDAFNVMADLASEGRKFDLVVCDPPAFAPNRQALEAGLRAYSRVARAGAALVSPGGYLVLCSCSHAADLARFRDACLRGIGKAGRFAALLHTGEAGPDHPAHTALAESTYLKSLFFRLD